MTALGFRYRKAWKFALAAGLAFTLGYLTTVKSAHAEETARFDLKVRQDFFAGYAGDRVALDRGMKQAEAELAEHPKNAEAMVWHGGGLTFLAGVAFQANDQQKGMELWTRGLQEMKDAIALAPDSVGTRVPRGALLLAMSHFVPEGMQKPLIEEGVADYEHTLALQKDFFATIGTHPRGELLFGIAEGYSRLGDTAKASAYFERLRSDLPNSVYAKRATVWLETKSLPANQTGCVGCHVPGK
jgi:hypothetical protein